MLEPHLGAGRFVVLTLICNATLWLSTRTALGTSRRPCDGLNTAAGAADDQGQECSASPPQETGSSERAMGVFFQVQVSETLEASSSLETLRVSSCNIAWGALEAWKTCPPHHSTHPCPSLCLQDSDRWDEAGTRHWRQGRKGNEPVFQAKVLLPGLRGKDVIVSRV